MNLRSTDSHTLWGTVPHVAIIGGGITGLATAYYLQKKTQAAGVRLRYTLFERSSALGGKIVTQKTDRFLVEGGPDCFLTRKPWALSLCRELGLEGDLLGTNDARRKVFVLNNRRLHPLPEGVMLIVPTRVLPFASSRLISVPGKLRMAMDLFIPPRREDGDETLASFVRRRLGQEALEKIAEPLLSGIHVSDPERLSLKSSFPRLLDVERKYGSLIRGMLAARRAVAHSDDGAAPKLPMFLTLRGGMYQLVEALSHALGTERIRTGHQVQNLESLRSGGPPYKLCIRGGESVRADAVVLTSPSNVASQVLRGLDPVLAEALAKIRYVSTAVVSFGYVPKPGLSPLNGFGLIIPKTEERRITACTWTSTKFDHRAPADHQLLRCFVGGPGRENIAHLDDERLTQVVREELTEILNLQAEPDLVRIFRWHKLNPQYDLGHLDRVAQMRGRAAGHGALYLAGSSYDGVGVPDCVRQGEETAEAVLADLAIRLSNRGEREDVEIDG